MSKLLPMPDIEVANPSGGPRIMVPGGWNARVAEITVDETTFATYLRAIGKAEDVTRIFQRTFESGFVTGLRLCIARRAVLYAQTYPELTTPMVRRYRTSAEYVTLRGFDPEVVQATYLPFDISGRAGNDNIREVLEQLANREKAKAA